MNENRTTNTFPNDFTWGAATAAYQVEGGANDDGRGLSIWDSFSHKPGRVVNGDTGDVGPDHYHRFREDVQLMRWLGVKAYRFSVSWSRVLPTGRGKVNEAGLAFYTKLVDELLANGIEPWVTCFHWDLPQAIEDEFGGWKGRDTAQFFGEYCELLARRLGDRVKHFFTINEFWNITDAGYSWGCKAPGLKLTEAELIRIRHHALLAHGLGVRALRSAASGTVRIGVAEALAPPVPVIVNETNLAAARAALRDEFFMSAMMEGRYNENHFSRAESLGIAFSETDMSAIGERLDFVGANSYAPRYVRAATTSGATYEIVPFASSHPQLGFDWLRLDPQIAYWIPRLLKEVWNVNDVVISENGCSAADAVTTEGEILDTDRLMYLRNHLFAAQRSVAEGWPLRGYFHWSLMDNFEWEEGYSKRLGLFHVDYRTLKRTPKLSAQFYKEVIRRNAVD